MSLADLITSTRQILNDPTGSRFVDALLTDAIRMALREYNQTNPQLRREVITLSGTGRTVHLSSISGLVNVVNVIFPEGHSSQYLPYQIQDSLTGPIILFTGELIPSMGDTITIDFTVFHTIAGLDGAAVTTLPSAHLDLLTQGAVGIALILHTQSLVEAYGGRPADIEKLTDLSTNFLEAFRKTLPHLQNTQQADYPSGFSLDGYDHQGKAQK
jgi:hypothetical protein